jgi:hypothetical protein
MDRRGAPSRRHQRFACGDTVLCDQMHRVAGCNLYRQSWSAHAFALAVLAFTTLVMLLITVCMIAGIAAANCLP